MTLEFRGTNIGPLLLFIRRSTVGLATEVDMLTVSLTVVPAVFQQSMINEPPALTVIVAFPLVALDPPQRPAAAQAAAFVVFQETVTEVPGGTAAGVLLPLTRRSTVGEAMAVIFTVSLTVVPAVFQQSMRN